MACPRCRRPVVGGLTHQLLGIQLCWCTKEEMENYAAASKAAAKLLEKPQSEWPLPNEGEATPLEGFDVD